MSLLLDPRELDARRPVVAGPLDPLATSLAGDLRKVITRPLYIPEQKALLSREGGRCPRDGTMLEFDPFSPREHRCPKCGETYRGDLHDGFWVYWYQLWLAERAVHAAVLSRLGVVPEAGAFAAKILDGYSDLYPKYPNVDNALGPTRPFFSTYLESIWLLQLCVAADLVESPAVDRFREAVVEPSVKLIASFDEGMSNRQVWNNAALIVAHRLLGRDDEAESVVWAESGVVSHLSEAMLADGTWYEGENYHFFAHRGLWYCMQLASKLNAGIPDDLVRRYDAGFRAPFLTSLPDLTFPSRRDSQYAVSLRQWRFAEMCELGLARADDRVLRGMLSRMYADDVGRGDTGRWRSTAEAERNLPATRLDRSDLGWKSLLMARPSLDLGDVQPLPSVLLDAQGIGVIRRDAGKVYVALDYGVSGGGHGHPDRLNLLISDGDNRILDDVGTGSYVESSLHWYRSTLAHNAPLVDGRSQPRVDGSLLAWEDRGAAGWAKAYVDPGFGRHIERTVVTMPDYVVDQLDWGAQVRTLDLPLHIDAEIVSDDATWVDEKLDGSDGDEDGFRFLTATQRLSTRPGQYAVQLRAKVGSTNVDVWVGGDAVFEVWRATAPGAPGKPPSSFILLRSREGVGRFRLAWSWSGAVTTAVLFPVIAVARAHERHSHTPVEHGWHIDIESGTARSSIDLEGLVRHGPAGNSETTEEQVVIGKLGKGETLGFELGEESYCRSEESWDEAGRPSAVVEIVRKGDQLSFDVTVSRVERTFVQAGESNRLDNENADINGAGLQLYLARGAATAGYVIVPEPDSSALRVRPIDGWCADIPVIGHWSATADGYRVQLDVQEDVAGGPGLAFDLIVNEKPAGRERRRGQLVLSGARGQFVYLRGDRHDIGRLFSLELTND
jgi:hypothetical protein